MFVSLKNIIPGAMQKNGIQKHVLLMTEIEKIEKILQKIIKQKIKIIKKEGRTIVIKKGGFSITNEIKLKQEEIKESLKKENIHITEIKYSM